MTSGGAVVVHESEVDGIPAFWVDAPGRSVGCLTFRVGHADEALSQRGVTHLVEHLSLTACDDLKMAYNGSVGPTTTTFIAAGSSDEVGHLLTTATRSLAALPWDRLDTEARILRAEAAKRGTSLVGQALGVRYGARGYGLAGYPELGVHHLQASAIDAWRRAWFTRQNAVLWFAGPPPTQVDLSALADGVRRPAPAPSPLVDQPLPCWIGGPPGTLAVVAQLPRTPAAGAAWGIAGARLRKRLRYDEGRSYDTSTSADPITADDAHAILATDCIPDEAVAARDVLVSELQRFAITGPTDAELTDHVDDVRRAAADPEGAPAHAERRAHAELFGRPVELDPSADLEVPEVAEVARALGDALRGAVWIVPDDVGMIDRRIHPIASSSIGEPPAGPTLHRPQPVASHHADRLVVDGEQVSLSWSGGRFVQVRWADCVAVQRWTDGGRTVWGADGFVIRIHPGEWADERIVFDAIDRHVSTEVVVPMPEALGPVHLDPPEPEPIAAGQPAAVPDGTWHEVKQAGRLAADAVLAAVAVFATLIATSTAVAPPDAWSGSMVVGTVVLAALIAAVFGSTFWRRRIAPDLAERAQAKQAKQAKQEQPTRPQPAPASGAGPIGPAPPPRPRRSPAVPLVMVLIGAVGAAAALALGAEAATVARVAVVYAAGVIAAARG